MLESLPPLSDLREQKWKKGLLLAAMPTLNLAPNYILNRRAEHSVTSNHKRRKIMSSLKKPCYDAIQPASSDKEMILINRQLINRASPLL